MLPLLLILIAMFLVLYLVRVTVQLANSVVIERSVTQVFAFVTNPENIPEWNQRVRSVRLITPGPTAAGSQWDASSVAQGATPIWRG